MNELGTISTELSSVSIRKAAPRNMVSDANKDEEVRHPAIAVEELRKISQIVQGIKEKIGAEERATPGDDDQRYPTGNPSSSTATSPNCSEDNNPESLGS